MRTVIQRRLLIVALLAAACGDDPADLDPQDVEFAAELGVDLDAMTRTQSGLYYQDLTVGTGDVATSGQSLRVLYQGWLPNGTLFDSALDVNDPFPFTLGVTNVIEGWHEGIAGMRAGGVRRLVIPPSLGYGNRPNGPIPANSVLVFEVTFLGAA